MNEWMHCSIENEIEKRSSLSLISSSSNAWKENYLLLLLEKKSEEGEEEKSSSKFLFISIERGAHTYLPTRYAYEYLRTRTLQIIIRIRTNTFMKEDRIDEVINRPTNRSTNQPFKDQDFSRRQKLKEESSKSLKSDFERLYFWARLACLFFLGSRCHLHFCSVFGNRYGSQDAAEK